MTENSLYKCDKILSFEGKFKNEDALYIENGFIKDISSFKNLRTKYPNVRVREFKNSLFIPPVVNAHTHLELSGIDKEKLDFSNEINWIVSLIKEKRTKNELFFKHSFEFGKSLMEKSFASYYGNIISKFLLKFFKFSENESLFNFVEVLCYNKTEIENIFKEVRKYRRLSPHTFFTVHPELMLKIFELENVNLAIHLFESLSETEYLYNNRGTVVDTLYKFTNLSPVKSDLHIEKFIDHLLKKKKAKVQFVHLCYLSENFKKYILKNREKIGVPVLCPRSNLILKNKLNFKFFIDNNLDFALGTDSLCSNNDIEVFNEAKFIYNEINNKNNGEHIALTLLKALTVNGIYSLMLPEKFYPFELNGFANFTIIKNPQKGKKIYYREIFENFEELFLEKHLCG